MHVIVIGAGLTGVTTAWYLAQAGHQVTVLERRADVGLETSFANGGQISVSHPEPWANPGAPWQILRSLGREDAPIRFRPRADWAQWRWAMAFLGQCWPSRTQANTAAIARLAAFSLQCLQELRERLDLEYDQETRGILHLFFSQKDLAKGHRNAEILAQFDIPTRMLDAEECVALEPALAHIGPRLVGGMQGVSDESGDAHKFTAALARHCGDAGVAFQFNTRVEEIDIYGSAAKGVVLRDSKGRVGVLKADRIVVCTGAETPRLSARWGQCLSIYPVKGYSLTVPIADPERAPKVSLTDEHRRIVCSRLGNRLRIAGTAELNGYDLKANPRRSAALLEWLEGTLPGAGKLECSEAWCGLRPATPSNRPIMGPSSITNLYLNSGHGTLGWTLCCGSAATVVGNIF